MIDIDLAVEAFKRKFSSMTCEERKDYLNKMELNVSYEEYTSIMMENEVNNILDIWNNINDEELKQLFIAEILPILGYKLLTLVKVGENAEEQKLKTIENNVKVIKCIHPIVDFRRMLNIYDTTEEKIKFLVQCRETLNEYKTKRINENFENITKRLL